MKRTILAVILLSCAIFCAYGQSSEPVDIVLVLNTSTGMSSSYENVNNYITGAFLTEFLRLGDTFHLIAFSATQRLDVARRISAVGDVETIIGRMLLQYPVETGNDVAGAIRYAEAYASSLPSRPKKIVLVSPSSQETAGLVREANQRLSSRNTTLDFVQVSAGQPLTNLPSSGRSAMTRTTSTATSSSAASSSATTSSASSSSTQTTTTSQGTSTTSGDSTFASDGTRIDSSSGQVSDSQQTSTDYTSSQGGVSDSQGTVAVYDPYSAQTDSASGKTKEAGVFFGIPLSLPMLIGIIILLLLLLALILFLVSRRLGSSPNRVMAAVSTSSPRGSSSSKDDFVDHSKDLAKYAAVQNRQRTSPYDDRNKYDHLKPAVINPSGPLLLNLFVEDQNTAIGKRNIHSLKSGYSLSVGGGKGDGFLIFLVPIPANIGELRRNGSSLTFIPRKPKYFPDIGSNEVRDCLNKTIRIISDKNYEMRFRFEMYEDPLIALNRMLVSVKVPG